MQLKNIEFLEKRFQSDKTQHHLNRFGISSSVLVDEIGGLLGFGHTRLFLTTSGLHEVWRTAWGDGTRLQLQ